MDKLKIYIPNDNLKERSYIIGIIVGDFLGLEYELIASEESTDYALVYNSKKAVILDSFFSNHKKCLSYLHIDSIPGQLTWFDKTGVKIPMIYGRNELITRDDSVFCGLDVFGSSYFMISRWEEYVITKKDRFGRSDENEQFLVKNNIFNRAVVCEYCDILIEVLKHIYPQLKILRKKFLPLITHDVDYLFRFGSAVSLGSNLLGDLINRKSILAVRNTISGFLKYKKGEIRDPFDTFDELMNLSEENNLRSSFYFKAGFTGEDDSTYDIFDKRVISIMKNVVNRGHEVGIHPSKNTFYDEQQFVEEARRIRSLGFSISGGRQHYLLYDIPSTFRRWEMAGLEYDCGMGFSQRIGFRCGVCWPFRVFDFVNRETLNLIEKPLLMMDASFLPLNHAPNDIFEIFSDINRQVKLYSGLFVLLWHNDNFNRHEGMKYKELYRSIVKSIS